MDQFEEFPSISNSVQIHNNDLYSIAKEESTMNSTILPPKTKPLFRKKTFVSFYQGFQYNRRSVPTKKLPKPRSQKIIVYSNNPYMEIEREEIPALIERLNDSPDALYEAIKRRKFGNQKYTLMFRHGKKSLKLEHDIKQSKSQHQLPSTKQNLQSDSEIEKQNELRLKSKIKNRRIQYEKEYRKIFQDKKQLNIVTDLPKIGRIRQDSIRETLKRYNRQYEKENLVTCKQL